MAPAAPTQRLTGPGGPSLGYSVTFYDSNLWGKTKPRSGAATPGLVDSTTIVESPRAVLLSCTAGEFRPRLFRPILT